MTSTLLWIEEPDLAAKYAEGVSRGIEVAYETRGEGRIPSGMPTSPAFHRGFRAGYYAVLRATGERS